MGAVLQLDLGGARECEGTAQLRLCGGLHLRTDVLLVLLADTLGERADDVALGLLGVAIAEVPGDVRVRVEGGVHPHRGERALGGRVSTEPVLLQDGVADGVADAAVLEVQVGQLGPGGALVRVDGLVGEAGLAVLLGLLALAALRATSHQRTPLLSQSSRSRSRTYRLIGFSPRALSIICPSTPESRKATLRSLGAPASGDRPMPQSVRQNQRRKSHTTPYRMNIRTPCSRRSAWPTRPAPPSTRASRR